MRDQSRYQRMYDYAAECARFTDELALRFEANADALSATYDINALAEVKNLLKAMSAEIKALVAEVQANASLIKTLHANPALLVPDPKDKVSYDYLSPPRSGESGLLGLIEAQNALNAKREKEDFYAREKDRAIASGILPPAGSGGDNARADFRAYVESFARQERAKAVTAEQRDKAMTALLQAKLDEVEGKMAKELEASLMCAPQPGPMTMTMMGLTQLIPDTIKGTKADLLFVDDVGVSDKAKFEAAQDPYKPDMSKWEDAEAVTEAVPETSAIVASAEMQKPYTGHQRVDVQAPSGFLSWAKDKLA